jgi:hypothetical protein
MGCGNSTLVSDDVSRTTPNQSTASRPPVPTFRETIPPTTTVTSPASVLSGNSDDRVAVIVVHFNPSGYARRAVLVNDCLQRLVQTQLRLAEDGTAGAHLEIVAVELCYGDKPAEINPSAYPTAKLVCCRCDPRHKMWSKEQLINLAFNDHLSSGTKYVTWIDSDVEFTDDSWVRDVVTCLSRHEKAFGQVWSTCSMMGPEDTPDETLTVTSFCAQFVAGKQYANRSNGDREYWHPGFAWMATASALRSTHGLIAQTLGSADRHMAMSFLGLTVETVPDGVTGGYLDKVLSWQERVKENDIKLLVVPLHILHHWHGPITRRFYMERWQIVTKNRFDPNIHLQWNQDSGLFLWSTACPPTLQQDVASYFDHRQEDCNKPSGHDFVAADSHGGIEAVASHTAAGLAAWVTCHTEGVLGAGGAATTATSSDPFTCYA